MNKNILIEKLKKIYKDKKVLIVGLGLQGGGVGLVKFFFELGAKVKATDIRDKDRLRSSIDALKNYSVEYVLGEHRLQDFLEADVIFKGPAVLWSLPEIAEAQKKGIPVEMELSFFSAHCPAKIIGVTGTRGKSTTTSMIYNILVKSGHHTYLAGSLPDISTINLLKVLKTDDWVVMELPSWPLSGFHLQKISPHIAVFTNIYPDHLNYYKNMDEYLYDKKAVYLYQKPADILIANNNLKDVIEQDNSLSKHYYFTKNDFQQNLKYLKGDHNLENAAAALKLSRVLNLDQKIAEEEIINFKGLSSRQQIVKIINNVTIINDTTSTTPVATIKAIDSFSDKPIVLILGGRSKNLPYKELITKLKAVGKIILLKGSFTDEILSVLKEEYPDKISSVFDDLEKAVKTAYKTACQLKKPCYLLFSPGATSFAMFNNEFHRGREFNKIVDNL